MNYTLLGCSMEISRVPPSEEEMATSTGYAGDAKPTEEHV